MLPADYLSDAKHLLTLGKGTFGHVELVDKPGVGKMAVKYLYRDELHVSTLHELDGLVRYKGVRDVVDFIGVCREKEGLAVLMEPMDRNLRAYINTTKDRSAYLDRFVRFLARCAALFEATGFMHLDIKPDNILVKDTPTGPIFKITDFGLSDVYLSKMYISYRVYSEWYRPPEYREDLVLEKETHAGDIWAMGATIYEYITGRVLHLEEDWSDVPSHMVDLLKRMLDPDPDKRPTGVELCNMLDERMDVPQLLDIISPRYPRRSRADHLEIIQQESEALSYITQVMAKEMYTRYYNLVDEISRDDLQAIVCAAACYTGDYYPSAKKARKVLETLGYAIFNPEVKYRMPYEE